MQGVFSSLIAGFGEAQLREHLAERRVRRVAAPEPGAAALPTFDDLSTGFAQGVFAPTQLRVICGHLRIDAERVGLIRDGRIDASVLEQFARQGATLVLNEMDSSLPALWDLCREGEALTGDRFRAAVFASFGSESGFLPHYDAYDLLVLQLAGAKHWHFHGEPVSLDYPIRPSEPGEEAGPVTHTELLRAGEMMFVPAGLFHHCNADGASMHLSLMWHRRRGASMARRLLKQAAGDALLCAPIGLMPGEDHVAARLAACKARLIEWIDAFDASALLELQPDGKQRPEVRPAGPNLNGPRLAVDLPTSAA